MKNNEYGLTKSEKLFADAYLADKDLNGTQAYLSIHPNSSKQAAGVSAHRMLKNAKIQLYIADKMKEREKRTEITQDMVVKELACMAFAKASDYAKVIEHQAVYTTDDGTRIPLYDKDGKELLVKAVDVQLTDNLTEDQVRAIAGIKNGKYGVEVSLNDKTKALELLGRHLGMFKDKLDISGALDTEKSKLDDLIAQMVGEDE